MKIFFHTFILQSFLALHLFAYDFGIDVPIEGIWKIDTAKKNVAFNLASGVGYNQVLKFDTDGKVYRVNANTLEAEPSKHTWTVKDGIVNIKFKTPNDSFIANFMFNSTYNDYIKIYKQTSQNCYLVILQNGKQEVNKDGIIMCKIQN
ncbi:MAG: hypothetical protein EOM29_10055 [Bacteroidia bacterium]|nr:hypothetical protein [Bacteroidia bacterium]